MSTVEADDVAAIIVRHVSKRMKAWGRRVPPEVDVLGAITDVTVADTMEGSSTLTVHMHDENWELLDSGFFDANKDGKLDKIEVNYPEGSKYWWRLTQIEVDRQDQRLVSMIFMERSAVKLMELSGPMKANRAKTTRAEFLKTLADRADLTFHSRELHKVEPVQPEDGKEAPRKLRDERRRANKEHGIHTKEKLTVKGQSMSRAQIKTAERLLDEATRMNAPRVPALALLYAAIGESSVNAESGVNSAGYGGVLGMNASAWAGQMNNVELAAHFFLVGGRGFQSGGALHLARAGVTNPAEIAVRVEVPSIWPDNAYSRESGHENFLAEAEAILQAYGGGGAGLGDLFGPTYYRKQYNFQVGGPDNPHENYWDASQRLAREVNWAYFVDGEDVFYDAETTLVTQKPIAVLDREEPAVIDWNYTWDARHICTEMTITVLCEVFEFRAGEVLRLTRFGAASTGSTAKQPGRWLIASSERSVYAQTTTFILKQPSKPNREPISELAQRNEPNSFEKIARIGDLVKAGDLPIEVARAYAEAYLIDRQHLPYVWGGGHGAAGVPSGGGFDCSGFVVAILAAGGMGFKRGGGTATSGDLESWGAAGQGDFFTVWASANHVWIQWHIKGAAWRADTSPYGDGPNGPHLRFAARPTSGFVPRHWPRD